MVPGRVARRCRQYPESGSGLGGFETAGTLIPIGIRVFRASLVPVQGPTHGEYPHRHTRSARTRSAAQRAHDGARGEATAERTQLVPARSRTKPGQVRGSEISRDQLGPTPRVLLIIPRTEPTAAPYPHTPIASTPAHGSHAHTKRAHGHTKDTVTLTEEGVITVSFVWPLLVAAAGSLSGAWPCGSGRVRQQVRRSPASGSLHLTPGRARTRRTAGLSPSRMGRRDHAGPDTPAGSATYFRPRPQLTGARSATHPPPTLLDAREEGP